jgi:hypothetical protein
LRGKRDVAKLFLKIAQLKFCTLIYKKSISTQFCYGQIKKTEHLQTVLVLRGKRDGVKSFSKIAKLKFCTLLYKNLFQTSFV